MEIRASIDGKFVNIRCLGRCEGKRIRTGVKEKSFSAAIISSGATYNSTNLLLIRAGIQIPVSQHGFYRFQKEKFIPWITEKRNDHLDKSCKDLRGKRIKISVDARWPTARNAFEGTVTCFLHPDDDSKKKIIEIQHIGLCLFAECFII